MFNQQIGQCFGRIRGKKTAVGKGQSVNLCLDRLGHLYIAMPQTRHRRAAGAVEITFAAGINQIAPLTTDSGGRVHTSAATVAVLPEAEDVDITIDANDLRIDTMRASGAGGQHVNTTDSAVRILHIPTGIIVVSAEKSQHRNREIAMQVMKTRLYDLERQRVDDERSADRKSQVGSGDRSERIRTYNFPQGRVSDHRINLTLYKLDQVMQGDLDELIDALTADAQATLLAEMET